MQRNAVPQVAITSQQGKRGDENDDHAAWFAVERSDRQFMVYVGVVADGVTSTAGGAKASAIAVSAIEAALREAPDPQETLSEWFAGAVVHANEEILFEARRHPEWQGMSSTVVMAALAGSKLYVMYMGDSRAYLLRNGQMHQLTTDHTWAQAAVTAGAITASEAATHPGRNQLQRYLGAQHTINVARGVLNPQSGQVDEYLTIELGDQLLLCTDGVYHRLPDASIRQMLLTHADNAQAAADALVAAAIANGETDDVTALVLTIPA
ncbi:MAG: serine/threonine-protein phosphatase [Caldilineaceae bacterium]|nr:serine/threonine-protein phosphatase [Caldilineaceae bacterium]MCB0139534.1 serine/threonine-protein phosphatase [Caldilineaceae bacterium]